MRLDRRAIEGRRCRPVFYVVKDDAIDHRTEIIDLWNAEHHLLVSEVGIEVDRRRALRDGQPNVVVAEHSLTH